MAGRREDIQAGALRLTPELLIAAYCQGVFPMARSRHAAGIEWYSPDPRGVLPLDRFHCPRTLRQRIRQRVFDVRCDTAFALVVEGCAQPRPGHPDTWINREIRQAYAELHAMGFAHSVEAWRGGRLVGGLYGVALGGAFFGESMYHRPDLGGTDASKVCLAWLVEHLRSRGFTLLDTQMTSEHMSRFGVVEISRRQYMQELERALAVEARW